MKKPPQAAQNPAYAVIVESIANWLEERASGEPSHDPDLLAAVRPHVVGELRERLTPLFDLIRPTRRKARSGKTPFSQID